MPCAEGQVRFEAVDLLAPERQGCRFNQVREACTGALFGVQRGERPVPQWLHTPYFDRFINSPPARRTGISGLEQK